MFSGIVKGTGAITDVRPVGNDRSLTISIDGLDLGVIAPGASVAINGICLTATRVDASSFDVDVSAQTLAVTTCAAWQSGTRVNIEPALRVGDALDGHFVTGHVDGVGGVVDVRGDGRSFIYSISVPQGLARFIAKKGSIGVDGVSLTVNAISGTDFEVNIVPFTQRMTLFGDYEPGSAVNIEVDIIARYLDRLAPRTSAGGGLDMEKLREYGYTDPK